MKIAERCDLCLKNKVDVKQYRALFGKYKQYNACDACAEDMKTTETLLKHTHNLNADCCRWHKNLANSGRFLVNFGTYVLKPINTTTYD